MTHFNRILRPRVFLALLLTLTMTASAAEVVRSRHAAVVKASVPHILKVLASNEVCKSGCRYSSPNVKKEIRIAHRATPSNYFKWKYIEDIRNTEFFTQVTVTKDGEATVVRLRTLQKEKDDALIKELEKKTKLRHAPLFDEGETKLVLVPKKSGTEVKASSMLKLSGLATLFTGKAKKGMDDHFVTLFANFNR